MTNRQVRGLLIVVAVVALLTDLPFGVGLLLGIGLGGFTRGVLLR